MMRKLERDAVETHLKTLLRKGEVVTVEQLAQRLGVSRGYAWKTLSRLVERGRARVLPRQKGKWRGTGCPLAYRLLRR